MMKTGNKKVSKDEIDLLELILKIWERRLFILKTTIIVVFLTVFFTLLIPNQFTAETVFLPQTSQSGGAGLSNLGGLAGLAGINLGLGGGASEIPPQLYPKIVKSLNYRLALLNAPVTLPEEKVKITYREYYSKYHEPSRLDLVKKYTIGLPSVVMGAFRGEAKDSIVAGKKGDSRILNISSDDQSLIGRLLNQVEVNPNSSDGTVSLKFSMPDPLMAAEMTAFAEQLLQKELIDYKIKNAKEDLIYSEAQLLESETAYRKAQSRLAIFRDKNQNLSTAFSRNEEQRLEAEFTLAFTVYSELAKQYQQAKLQVSKDTPVFTIIDPVTIPTGKSSPNRKLAMIIAIFIGLTLSILYIFIKEMILNLKQVE
ncbi:Wzz/FepE/Etk N-terminal domain-containing protein [Penaeicola halotolerans]|uniref:Wzz/FepE/Etk N-terminal domain-containing protein n=1 Tax=Penaeicola halotolerans TaxID=2793196 RepID=UPI001CF86B51|nr:Wzz/FepE/Etk N-terminal domain-containing protein [Penaeicola halotolerans]